MGLSLRPGHVFMLIIDVVIGDAFLITAPRSNDFDKYSTHKKWLLVFLASDQVIIKAQVTLDLSLIVTNMPVLTFLFYLSDKIIILFPHLGCFLQQEVCDDERQKDVSSRIHEDSESSTGR